MTLMHLLAVVDHPIWYYNAFFYLFVISTIVFFIIGLSMMKVFRKKTAEMKLMQQQHAARIDVIRKDHSEAIEKLRLEMLKREEERVRQWMESDKEGIQVLNKVLTLLDLSEKLGKVDSKKIIDRLETLNTKVDKITPKD